MRGELASLDRIQKRQNFRVFTGYLKFYSAVRKISHPAGDIIPGSNVTNRPSETDALNATLVKDLKRNHAVTKIAEE